MIFFNGQTGSLGRYFQPIAPNAQTLEFRLDPKTDYDVHWSRLLAQTLDNTVTLIPLAGMVSVPACEKDPEGAHLINVTECGRLVKSFIKNAKILGKKPHVAYVSTGHVYAECREPGKITETDATAPRSVYARTKLEAEKNISKFSIAEKTPLDIFRVFGLVAPMQPPHYVLQSFIRRVKEKNYSSVPGLSFYRDYLDSRDVCRVLAHAMTQPCIDGVRIFNVCSGHPVQMKTLIDEVARALQISVSDYANLLTEGPKRADDVPWIVGDPSFFQKTFQTPTQTISLSETIQNALKNC